MQTYFVNENFDCPNNSSIRQELIVLILFYFLFSGEFAQRFEILKSIIAVSISCIALDFVRTDVDSARTETK